MDDEFKLCWKNFQDNIASGFQSLYDRGDLVDVTLACDGKLLQAHKIVLAICSPYFQEIFITNPCKHPIIILKDVSYAIMCELLEFMYQGVVNVKHTELQAFMKIGQLLQIKGLATNSSSAATSSSSDKSNSNHNLPNNDTEISSQASTSQHKSATTPTDDAENNNENVTKSEKSSNQQTNSNSNTPLRTQSPVASPRGSPALNISSVNSKSNDSQSYHIGGAGGGVGVSGGSGSSSANAMSSGHKRHLVDFNSDSLSIYSRNKMRRSLGPSTDHGSENNDNSEMGGNGSMDQMNAEDFFLPHLTMVEARYDLNSVKREGSEHQLHPNGPSAAAAAAAAASLRNSFNPSAFGLDYTFYKNGSGGPASSSSGGAEYPNDLNPSGDYCKGFANHMDIPPNCPNVVMLSSTSLLHGNCVFNRNNTVATQQGMKTYWLCKSYRISMCRARCITHQGKIISATGVHNHPPHMRGNNAGVGANLPANSDSMTPSGSNNGNNVNPNCPPPQQPSQHNGSGGGNGGAGGATGGGLRFPQNIPPQGGNMFQPGFHGQHHGHPMTPMTPPSSMQHPHPLSADVTPPSMSTSSHHFANSVSNLIQHPSAHQLLGPNVPHHQTPGNSAIQTIMHGSAINSPQHAQSQGGVYDAAPTMDHNRIANQQQPPPVTYDRNDETDDHIPVQNAAELSPSNAKGGHYNENSHHPESSPHQHQHRHHQQQQQQQHHSPHRQQSTVQVIDSITISPGGNGHNFKMEPL